MNRWTKVYARQYDFDEPKGRRVLLAQFKHRADAHAYAESVVKSNPTWQVYVDYPNISISDARLNPILLTYPCGCRRTDANKEYCGKHVYMP